MRIKIELNDEAYRSWCALCVTIAAMAFLLTVESCGKMEETITISAMTNGYSKASIPGSDIPQWTKEQ